MCISLLHGQSLDVLLLICSHMEECRQLGCLVSACRRFRDQLGLERGSSSVWYQLALRITGYEERELPFDPQTASGMKRWVQLLVCPWLSPARPLQSRLGPKEDCQWRIQIMPLGRKRLLCQMRLLHVQMEEEEDVRHYTMPSVPLDRGVPVEMELKQPLPRLKEKQDQQEALIAEAVQYGGRDGFLRAYKGGRMSLRWVHKGVVASISAVKAVVTEDLRQMVVTFFTRNGYRFLRSIVCERMDFLGEVDLCFLPCEMWALHGRGILYYGPQEGSMLLCDDPEHVGGRMHKAFALLAGGDALGAARHVREVLLLPVDQRCFYAQETLLLAAVQMGRDACRLVKDLVDEAGMAIDACNGLGQTPLMMACSLLRADLAKALLERGADCDARCYAGHTALYYTGLALADTRKKMSSREAIVSLLVDARADTTGSLWQKGFLSDPICIRRLLLGAGSPTAAYPLNGYTPIHYLMEHNLFNGTRALEKALALLVESKVDVNAQSTTGITALMIASSKGNEESQALLVDVFHADSSLKDVNGEDSASYARKVRAHFSEGVLCVTYNGLSAAQAYPREDHAVHRTYA